MLAGGFPREPHPAGVSERPHDSTVDWKMEKGAFWGRELLYGVPSGDWHSHTLFHRTLKTALHTPALRMGTL